MTITTYTNQPHGPAQRLAELAAQYQPNDPQINRPGSLPVADIEAVPELFQPRGGMSEHHLGDLIRAIERVGTLDPIMVMLLGSRVILVDGHHRLEAYRRAGKPTRVPVVYFPGSPEDAVLAAGEANSKAKLPMTGSERQNHAWRLVLLDRHSKAKIAQASGVSVSQVGNMRKVMVSSGMRLTSMTRGGLLGLRPKVPLQRCPTKIANSGWKTKPKTSPPDWRGSSQPSSQTTWRSLRWLSKGTSEGVFLS